MKAIEKKPWLEHYDIHVPSNLEYPDETLIDLFRNSVLRDPKKVFLFHRGRKYNYGNIDKWVNALAGQLHAYGLQKGDRVAVILPNIPEFVIAYYAILLCGGIVVALNPSYKSYELEYLLNDASPKIIICLEKHQEIIEKIPVKKSIGKIITLPQKSEESRIDNQEGENDLKHFSENEIAFKGILHNGFETPPSPFPKVTGNDAAIFQYSGGTTGSPKAAIGTHRNIVTNTVQFAAWCNLKSNEEVILAAIPLYHVYGMVLAMNLGVYTGASIVLIDDPRDMDILLESIETYKVTFFPGVPSIYYAINQNPHVKNGEIKLGSIRACISGSAPLHPVIKSEFETLTKARLMEGYGLSEAPTATHCNPLHGVNKAGSIGMPLPDVNCRIVDLETGNDVLGANEIGELVIQGPQVMRGYYNRPEEDQIAIRDGWLFTGDVAKFDDDGYFFIVDRKKSMIKVKGLQVWPNELETVIASHPDVKECGVGGVPDLALGEKVIAWVVAKSGVILSQEMIQHWCRQYLSGYKVPKEVIFIDAIPRTGVGKILRRVLISKYLDKK